MKIDHKDIYKYLHDGQTVFSVDLNTYAVLKLHKTRGKTKPKQIYDLVLNHKEKGKYIYSVVIYYFTQREFAQKIRLFKLPENNQQNLLNLNEKTEKENENEK